MRLHFKLTSRLDLVIAMVVLGTFVVCLILALFGVDIPQPEWRE